MQSDVIRLVGYSLKWSSSHTEAWLNELEAAGVYVTYRVTNGELCPRCARHLATEETGFCPMCDAEDAEFTAREQIDEEHAKLTERVRRMQDVIKQQRKRMRTKFLANPRDPENRRRWEIAQELLADIEAAQDREFGEEE